MDAPSPSPSQGLVVVKIGGAADVDLDATLADVARCVQAGQRLVVVHGGSADATQLGEQLGYPPRFVTSPSGHRSRVTDARTLEIFLMATAGRNRRIVTSLRQAGVDAVGLSGLDGGLVRARRKAAIRYVEDGRVRVLRDDWTGRPETARTDWLEDLLARGLVPVIAPVAQSEKGEALNVDGDRLAALLASSLQAEALVLLTGAPGLMTDFPNLDSLVPHVGEADFETALGWAEGAMKKKVLGAREAIEGGLQRVVISGSSGASPLADALAGAGTVLGQDWEARGEVQA